MSYSSPPPRPSLVEKSPGGKLAADTIPGRSQYTQHTNNPPIALGIKLEHARIKSFEILVLPKGEKLSIDIAKAPQYILSVIVVKKNIKLNSLLFLLFAVFYTT